MSFLKKLLSMVEKKVDSSSRPYYQRMENKLREPNLMCITSAVIRSSKTEK
uniref:Uncharacterized protein n=1 Tax=Providencia alcalifaciens TaxID=126385 RepID=H7C8H0_9GAMM|nr:hypothetical protein [Providencia alcalifaciens]